MGGGGSGGAEAFPPFSGGAVTASCAETIATAKIHGIINSFHMGLQKRITDFIVDSFAGISIIFNQG